MNEHDDQSPRTFEPYSESRVVKRPVRLVARGSRIALYEYIPSPVPESAQECEFGDEEYQWRLWQAGY